MCLRSYAAQREGKRGDERWWKVKAASGSLARSRESRGDFEGSKAISRCSLALSLGLPDARQQILASKSERGCKESSGGT